jgi:hypothetical protein
MKSDHVHLVTKHLDGTNEIPSIPPMHGRSAIHLQLIRINCSADMMTISDMKLWCSHIIQVNELNRTSYFNVGSLMCGNNLIRMETSKVH